MKTEKLGRTHPWQNGDGEPAACPECLEREIERLRRRMERFAAAADWFWRDRDDWIQVAGVHAKLLAAEQEAMLGQLQLAQQVANLELLAGEQGELIGRLRMQIPVDAPPPNS